MPFTWVLTPICIWIGISFYDLFDIDRLIGATISYTALGIALLATLFALVPTAAAAVTATFGIEPVVTRSILSVLSAVAVVSAHRWLRPQVDRVLFAERYALERGIESLLDELPAATSMQGLLARVAERLNDLIRPQTCLLHVRVGSRYVPIIRYGADAALPEIEAQGPLIAALEARTEPLVDPRRRDRGQRTSSPFDNTRR